MTLLLACAVAVLPLQPVSVATASGAYGVTANPAALGANRGLDFLWFYNFRGGLVRESWRDHSFVAAAGPVGAYWCPGPGGYGIAAGFGRGAFAAGARVAGDSSGSGLDLGVLVRPLRWASAGAVWRGIGKDDSRLDVGLGLRPLTERVTVFAETEARWPLLGVFGIEAQPVDGLVLSCAAAPGPTLKETRWTAGARLSGGHAGIGWVGSVAPGYSRFGETALFLRASSQRRPSVLPRMRRYVEIRLSGRIVEEKPGPSITGGSSRTLWELLRTLDQAREDRSIAGLLLWLESPQMSLAQAEEIRAALGRLREAGKKVLVYAPTLGMGSYYLASVADRIACHPLGGVDIPGFAAQSLLLKGTLEKLDIGVQFHRYGRYKSAIETFSEDSMSAESREQLGDYLDAVYGVFRGDVATGRSVSPSRVDSLIEVAWFGAPEAQAAGLVDTLLYYDEVADVAKSLFGRAHKVSESDYTGVDRNDDRWGEPPAVAVIYAVGDIVTGESGTDFLSGSRRLGARTLCDAIAAARKERRVKAVVLRIDSPGGDGFASDLIWRELELLRKQKPLVVSMAGVAASGGYYIACNAGRVYASPATLTGSIGVFDLGFVTEGLYNKLGARREVVKRGSKADARTGTRPYTGAEDSLIQAEVERFYRQFTRKVAAGRAMAESAVDSAGQGRIWSGSDARRLGLVDSLGGLREALDCARSLGKVGECDYIIYPRRKPGLSGLRDLLAEQVLEALLW